MQQDYIRNLLVNGSFDEGDETPAGWEWAVVAGRPMWTFDYEVKASGRRSIKILQDVGRSHGEFRQRVTCEGGRRYRLVGVVKTANEGTGEQCGANLYARTFSGDKEIRDTYHRPFLLGRGEWAIRSMEFVTPREAESVLVSFDMRNSDGVCWFDEVRLTEAAEPLEASVTARITAGTAGPAGPAGRKVARAHVVGAKAGDRFTSEILAGLLGKGNVSFGDSAAAPGGDEWAALFIAHDGRKRVLARAEVEKASEARLVVLGPREFANVFAGTDVRVEEVKFGVERPCARIRAEGFLTRGLSRGDVVGWGTVQDASGGWRQVQIKADEAALTADGFETVAVSKCGMRYFDDEPLVLWRPGTRGGGILVMDLSVLEARPELGNDGNIACLLLSNALGRPQTYFGKYTVPQFDYEAYVRWLQRTAQIHEGLEISEEGRSGEGRPIYSLSLGPKGAPTFFVDCGMHPDEWAPCYGAPMYMARLADEVRAGLPWARALLGSLRIKCIPLVAPDGWHDHNRSPRGVNLNRNFPDYWTECGDADKGSAALSEPEAQIIDRILRGENVIAAVNWHETSANTNWVGCVGWSGRYAKYRAAAPEIFRQVIDGRHFQRQPSVWTQVWDERNYHYHFTDSYPYLRDYSASKSPFEIRHADALGIDGFIVEQYGNSDFAFTASPQRTDMTGFIFEMLLGLEVGLVCRNARAEAIRLSVPLASGGKGEAVVYAADGGEVSRRALAESDGAARAELMLRSEAVLRRVVAEVPPGGCVVVELDPAPWTKRG